MLVVSDKRVVSDKTYAERWNMYLSMMYFNKSGSLFNVSRIEKREL